jgi:hypothetical protein
MTPGPFERFQFYAVEVTIINRQEIAKALALFLTEDEGTMRGGFRWFQI